MVILLVALTFVVLISIGAYLEYREKQAAAAREAGPMVAQPVFVQDGGEPVETVDDSDNSETDQ